MSVSLVFLEKTDQVFSSDFKGFEFTIGDEKFTYSPGDATTIKKAQSNPMNFVKKFIDEIICKIADRAFKNIIVPT